MLDWYQNGIIFSFAIKPKPIHLYHVYIPPIPLVVQSLSIESRILIHVSNLHVLITATRLGNIHMLNAIRLLLRHAHFRSKGGVRHPFGRRHRRRLFQHTIDLLESETLGFWDEEVCVDEAEDAERAPEEEDLGAKINTTTGCRGDVRSHDSDDLFGISFWDSNNEMRKETYAVP